MSSSSLRPYAPTPLRLGINIDHVATLRNARGGTAPDPLRAALVAKEAGADIITAHLREDRRHIRDTDMQRLRAECGLPLNMEMAVTDEMTRIALQLLPHAVCLVPERRLEITTEGGLDVIGQFEKIKACVGELQHAGIEVALFIGPDEAQIDAAKKTGCFAIELHTGSYADAGATQGAELKRLQTAAHYAATLGIEVHAGHGLTYDNVSPIAVITPIVELNIGHFLMGEAMFVGMHKSIHHMKHIISVAR
ncbi:MAG: pyridoxine 5'-phosphate synthase [Alphaproteobacteria bacterium]|nr:pyridoxine 5'-phosphate synthase [Alphaproteobacteria bacterium]